MWNFLQLLNLAYKPLVRQTIGGTLLNAMYEDTKQQINTLINKMDMINVVTNESLQYSSKYKYQIQIFLVN